MRATEGKDKGRCCRFPGRRDCAALGTCVEQVSEDYACPEALASPWPQQGQAGCQFRPIKACGVQPSRLADSTASMRRVTSSGMVMVRPHSRLVSPGHLLVASRPILPPRPLTGEAKSR